MIQLLLALIASLGQSLGGKTGALVSQIVAVVGTGYQDTAEWKAWAEPWIRWVNGIIDAGRDPTDAEHDAARALADAVRANNESLASGGAGVPLPNAPTSA